MHLDKLIGQGPHWDRLVEAALDEAGALRRDDIKDRYVEDDKGIWRLEVYFQRGRKLLAVRYVDEKNATVELLD